MAASAAKGPNTAVEYLVNTGIDYEVAGEPRRVEPGDLVSDLPASSLSWLLEQGVVSLPAPATETAEVAV